MAPTDRPPGKPPAMPAEVFNNRIKQLTSLRAALRKASCVESFGVYLDDDAEVYGWAKLHDRHEADAFDAALAECNATLDARSLDPPIVRDGGKMDDLGVAVRFSTD